jgi:hypothetical protein
MKLKRKSSGRGGGRGGDGREGGTKKKLNYEHYLF